MPRFERAIPILAVHDIESALAFYAGKLGFTTRHKDEAFAVLQRDGIELHLGRRNDRGWHHRADFARRPVVTGTESFLAGTSGCRLAVRDVDTLYAELQETGALSARSELRDQPSGERDFTVFDPDGNGLTFYERR